MLIRRSCSNQKCQKTLWHSQYQPNGALPCAIQTQLNCFCFTKWHIFFAPTRITASSFAPNLCALCVAISLSPTLPLYTRLFSKTNSPSPHLQQFQLNNLPTKHRPTSSPSTYRVSFAAHPATSVCPSSSTLASWL